MYFKLFGRHFDLLTSAYSLTHDYHLCNTRGKSVLKIMSLAVGIVFQISVDLTLHVKRRSQVVFAASDFEPPYLRSGWCETCSVREEFEKIPGVLLYIVNNDKSPWRLLPDQSEAIPTTFCTWSTTTNRSADKVWRTARDTRTICRHRSPVGSTKKTVASP